MILAGTGHRPDKLGGYHPHVYELLKRLAIKEISNLKPTKVISGMALGWDQALAEAALELNIHLVAAIPFLGQESMWPAESRERYRNTLLRAETVICSPGGYAASKMQTRNCWMVNNADIMLALWNGTKGGTKNCVNYALKMKKPIVNCWNAWEELQSV